MVPRPEETDDPLVIPITQTPKRSGDDWKAPCPQRPRTSDGAQEFLARYCKSFRDVASSFGRWVPLDFVVAVTHSMEGWPSYQGVHGLGDRNVLLQDDVFSDVKFAGLPHGARLQTKFQG